MYTLRIIDSEGIANHELGNSYSTVSLFENKNRFSEIYKEIFSKDFIKDKLTKEDERESSIIGFVIGANDNYFPVYEYDKHYIMTESGRTFERLNKFLTRQRGRAVG